MMRKPLLRVAAEQWIPWTQLEKENGSLQVYGPMGDTLKILAELLNFDYEILQPADHVWGASLGNGSWSGMIGMVSRGEAEFALGPFSNSPSRESVIDFTIPVQTDSNVILTVRPTITNDMEGLLKPFTLNVWMSTLASLVVVSLAMILSQKMEGWLFNSPANHVISKSVIWAFKTVTQESSTWLPKSDGGRVIVSTWLLASLVFLSSYSGILTAMLTIPKVTIPIDSLGDLVSQNKLPWKLLTGTFLSDYFKESKDPVRQKAYKGMIGTVPDCWNARQDIVDGKFAGICVETTAHKVYSWDFSTTGRCHVYIAREKVYTNNIFSLAFKQKSSYLEKTNKVIYALKESGIMSKWLNQHVSNVTHCMRPPSRDLSGEGIRALNIEALVGPFILLVFGYLLAFLAFIGEIMASSKENLKKKIK